MTGSRLLSEFVLGLQVDIFWKLDLLEAGRRCFDGGD